MSSLKKSLGVDLPTLAEMIRSKGRGKDTMLAHITPREAALLKKQGGSGSINPDTGLPEFEDSGFYDVGPTYQEMGYTPPVEQAGPTYAEMGYTPPAEQAGPTYAEMGYTPTAPVTAAAPGSYDVEAQQGGFYGGRAPTAGEFAATQVEPIAPGVQTPAGQEKGILDKLGISGKDALRLGVGATLAGGLTAQNIARTRQAGQQAQAAKGELSAMAAPYKEAGAKLTGAAERGELTPANQQALQAARAQVNQGIATRGGVGAQQAANQIANLQALLLQNQYDYGIKISNIGDQYALGAIKSGLEADRAIANANQQFYGQLAQMIAPFITGAPAATPTR
jgi:hypothetical protein